jgi:hypothetical protein
MPLPMSYAELVRLAGSTAGSMMDRLKAFFFSAPQAKAPQSNLSYVDRERGWLMNEGCPSGLSRTDMWKVITGATGVERPYTDRMKALAAMPRSPYTYRYVASCQIGANVESTYVKA